MSREHLRFSEAADLDVKALSLGSSVVANTTQPIARR
jgi:hypothetical protein